MMALKLDWTHIEEKENGIFVSSTAPARLDWLATFRFEIFRSPCGLWERTMDDGFAVFYGTHHDNDDDDNDNGNIMAKKKQRNDNADDESGNDDLNDEEWQVVKRMFYNHLLPIYRERWKCNKNQPPDDDDDDDPTTTGGCNCCNGGGISNGFVPKEYWNNNSSSSSSSSSIMDFDHIDFSPGCSTSLEPTTTVTTKDEDAWDDLVQDGDNKTTHIRIRISDSSSSSSTEEAEWEDDVNDRENIPDSRRHSNINMNTTILILSDDDDDEEQEEEYDSKIPPTKASASSTLQKNKRQHQRQDDSNLDFLNTQGDSSCSSSSGVDDDEFEWNEEENERDSNDSSTSSSSSIPDITNRTKNITISSDKENENDEQQTKASIQKPRKKRTSKKSSSDHKSLKATQQQQQQRRTFRKHREEWTIEYLHKYDRMVFDGNLVTQPQSSSSTTQQDDQRQPLLTVSWSNKLRTTAGLTRLRRKAKNHQQQKHDDSKSLSSSSNIYRTADIELSTKVLDTLERLKCTLLHEMCHAAQWILDGNAKPMHGPIFKKWARWASKQTGVPISVRHSYEIVYKYAWQCESCHVIIQRHSRSVNIERHRCGTCRSRLREIQPPTSTTSTTSVSKSTFAPSSRRKRVETPYNRFVREQSSSVRQRLLLLSQSIDANHAKSKISQSDVLRECARLWRIQQQN